jgi:hypothetical protein
LGCAAQGTPTHPQRLGANAAATTVQGYHRDLTAATQTAKDLIVRHFHAIQL